MRFACFVSVVILHVFCFALSKGVYSDFGHREMATTSFIFFLICLSPSKKIEEGARKINGPHGTYFEKKMANPESFKTYSPVLNVQKGA